MLATEIIVQTLQDNTSAAEQQTLAAEVKAAKDHKVLKTLKGLTDIGPRVAATQSGHRPLEDEPPVCFILHCDMISEDAVKAGKEMMNIKHAQGIERWAPIRNTDDDGEKCKGKVDNGR